MAGDFGDKIDELAQRVGSDFLVGEVTVDQVYAQYQHEGLDLDHPRGGQAHYLTDPLLAESGNYLQEVADTVLNDGGVAGMATAMDNLAGSDGASGIATTAPVLFGDLRDSGHPQVFDSPSDIGEGRIVFDREPRAHRLTEAELKAKGRLLPLDPKLLGYIWWHVLGHTEPPGHRAGGYVELAKAVDKHAKGG
jgi:hypothetical protein